MSFPPFFDWRGHKHMRKTNGCMQPKANAFVTKDFVWRPGKRKELDYRSLQPLVYCLGFRQFKRKSTILNLNESQSKFSRRQSDDIFFLILPRKHDLKFPANCLHLRQFAWNVKSCFSGKEKKKFQNVVCWIFYPACWAQECISIDCGRHTRSRSRSKLFCAVRCMDTPFFTVETILVTSCLLCSSPILFYSILRKHAY